MQLTIRKCRFMGFLEIIRKQYFLRDNLEWIENPKFQLSNKSGCRDIANSKTHKILTKNLQTRIEICYIFLDLQSFTFRNWRIDCYFKDLLKKQFWGVKILSHHLEFFFFYLKIYHNSGSINPKKHVCFFRNHTSRETFVFLLTKYEKIFCGI